VAARRTLIAIIRIIVSAVMDVETHTAKHKQQKCDHWPCLDTHTIYKGHSFIRWTCNLQVMVKRAVSSPRRNAAAER